MYIQILRLAIVATVFIFVTPALGQGSGFINSGYGLSGSQNCGRAITQQQAEGLWADYCTEGCTYQGGGGGGRKCGRCGLKGGACGCNSGSFGYPTGGGCGGGGCGGGKLGGCKLGSRHGGCGCKLKGLHSGGGGCDDCGGGHGGFAGDFSSFGGGLGGFGGGHGGCGCKLKGRHGGGHGGCKLKGLHGGGHGGCGCKLFGGCKKFGHSAQQCGTSGAYFEEAVGYEYGTGGMESCVSCNSCGSFDSLAPQMAVPFAQPESVLGPAVDSVPYNAPVMAEPVVGAIGALN